MKNINILKDLKTLNKLHAPSVESYTTNNGIVDFTCDNNGYVDNVVIEGKTLVNLTLKQSPIWEDSGTNASDGNRIIISDMHHNLVSPNIPYTFFNCSDKDILILGLMNHGVWSDVYTIPSNSSMLIQFNKGNYLGAIIGYEKDGWTSNDLGTFSKACVVLEGDHIDKPISYFEGLKSVGQGDKIEVLTYKRGSENLASNLTFTEGKYVVSIDGGIGSNVEFKHSNEYIEVEGGCEYLFDNINGQFAIYDSSKNVIPTSWVEIQDSWFKGDNYQSSFIYAMPKNAKYVRINLPISNLKPYSLIKTKSDKKQISTTLRSLPNGVKDTIEKRGNKYVKVQRCGEITLNGNESDDKIVEGVPTATTYRFGFILSNLAENPPDAICVSDKFPSECNNNWASDKEQVDQDRGSVNIRILRTKLVDGTKASIKNWLKSNPITIVYQLAIPQIIELPNFNPQTYEGDNTLLINSGVIQCDASFDVSEGIRSELDVIKNKVSSLDNYESGYEFSNEVIYLNGTYKPGFAETPYIVRIGKICILHCAIGNDAPQRGMHVLKLPSFAKPKDHHRCAGRAKINDETINPILVDYDITLDNTVQIWTTHETTKLNEMYIHMIWEVE